MNNYLLCDHGTRRLNSRRINACPPRILSNLTSFPPCSVVQCGAARCSVLQCVAVCWSANLPWPAQAHSRESLLPSNPHSCDDTSRSLYPPANLIVIRSERAHAILTDAQFL